MARIPPYRFVATEGMYAGTTFVYPDQHTVISYNTDEPGWYFRSPAYRPGNLLMQTTRHIMTPEDLARLNAYPEES